MTAENALPRDRIRALNDTFRRSFVGGTIVVTAGLKSLSADRRHSILAKIRAFDNFNEDNDPPWRARLRSHPGRRCALLLENRLLRHRHGPDVA
jgi:hypothetical protein